MNFINNLSAEPSVAPYLHNEKTRDFLRKSLIKHPTCYKWRNVNLLLVLKVIGRTVMYGKKLTLMFIVYKILMCEP